jgi:Hexameric tyrosine-coordinated heme protein (HTHP)
MELVPGNSLITSTPEEGRALALTLARHSIHAIQPDEEVLKAGRPKYSTNADSRARMKAETFLKFTLCHSSLSFTYNRYENRHQLVRLVCQRLQLISSAESCSFQQLQPIALSPQVPACHLQSC